MEKSNYKNEQPWLEMYSFIFTTGFYLFSLDSRKRRSKDSKSDSDFPEKLIFFS